MILVVADTAQIQPFIFGSNRLRENVGASYLVSSATGAWALAEVRTAVSGSDNILDIEHCLLDLDRRIEKEPELSAEVLYTGGGNLAVLFRTPDAVECFIRGLSRKVLTEAPNLRLILQTEPVEREGKLREVVETAFRKLGKQKQSQARSRPLLGLGVTQACVSTGWPAVGMSPPVNEDTRPASAETLAKLTVFDTAEKRLEIVLPPPPGFLYPREFDEMGRSLDSQSYLGVVHADGDGIGSRLERLARENSDDRSYIRALRLFSNALQDAGRESLRSVIDQLSDPRLIQGFEIKHGVETEPGKFHEITSITLRESKELEGRYYLPFRPLVFGGGEDVTFVCDGRLAVSAAVRYLEEFQSRTENLPGGGEHESHATACAGVAVVKVHYPFSRAYELAEELCGSAKSLRRKIRSADESWNGSCLDWHFALYGLSGDIEEIRRREFRPPRKPDRAGHESDDRLTLRPVSLGDNPHPDHSARTWPVVRQSLDAFQGKNWAGRRNKLKALRTALREGEASVTRFLQTHPDARLPEVSTRHTAGWTNGRCVFFDAVELADLYIPLPAAEETNDEPDHSSHD